MVRWTRESAVMGKPWVIGFDEPGTAGEGMPADEDYPGMPENFDNPNIDTTRAQAVFPGLSSPTFGLTCAFDVTP